MNAAAILGSEITDFEELESKDDVVTTEEDYAEVRDIHFYAIRTTVGVADVTLHVDHNGYYGGWLNGPSLVNEMPAALPIPEA